MPDFYFRKNLYGHIGKPLGYPLQVLAVAVGFTLLSLMR